MGGCVTLNVAVAKAWILRAETSLRSRTYPGRGAKNPVNQGFGLWGCVTECQNKEHRKKRKSLKIFHEVHDEANANRGGQGFAHQLRCVAVHSWTKPTNLREARFAG